MENLSIKQILKASEEKNYRIPNFQRDFVWKEENIIKLIDSMIKKFPVGNFLMLNCNNNSLKLTYSDINVEESKIFTSNISEDSDSFYILDGQQRITSLARAFFDADKKFHYCFNLESFLKYISISNEFEEEINLIDYIKKGKKFNFENFNEQNKYKYIPLKEINSNDNKNKTQILRKFIAKNKDLADEDYAEEFKVKCIECFNELLNYPIPVQKLDNKTPIESIVRIFETINNTGIKLDVFDLLVAKTFVSDEKGNGFNLKEKIEIENQKYDNILKSDSLIQALLFAHQLEDKTYLISTKKKILELTRTNIEKHFDGLVLSFIEIEKFLIEKKFKYDCPINIKIMLAVSNYKYKILHLKNDIIKLILFRMLDEKQYNREVINYDILIFKNIFEKKTTIEKELKDLIKIEKYDKNNIIEVTKKSKKYEPLMYILNHHIEKDIFNNNLIVIEDHHIIPDKHITTSFGKETKIYKYKDSIVNLIWVDKKTNQQILNNAPNKYFIDMKKIVGNEYNKIISNYFIVLSIDKIINELKVEENSYMNFLEKRADKISAAINNYFKDYII